MRHHRLYNGNKGAGLVIRGGRGQRGTHRCVPERSSLTLSVRSEPDVVISQHCGPTELPERNLHTHNYAIHCMYYYVVYIID